MKQLFAIPFTITALDARERNLKNWLLKNFDQDVYWGEHFAVALQTYFWLLIIQHLYQYICYKLKIYL